MKFNWMAKFAVVFGLWIASLQVVQAADCTYVNGEVDVASIALDSNGKDRNCNFTPDEVKIKVFDIYLCEELPTYSNYRTSCSSLFSSSAGKDIELSKGTSSSMADGAITLQEGGYKYAALVMENTFSIKFQADYTMPIRGKSGVGTTCWTNGNDVKIFYGNNYPDFSSECGTSSAANPQFSRYTYAGLYHPAYPSNPFKNAIDGIAIGRGASAYILSGLNTLATVTPGSDPQDPDAVVTDGNKILGIYEFPNAQVVSAATQNVDMGISVDKGAFMKITSNTFYADNSGPICNSGGHGSLTAHATSGAHSCLATSYPTSLRFKFEVN